MIFRPEARHAVLDKSPCNRALLVQKTAVEKTHGILQEGGKCMKEAVAYWYGVEQRRGGGLDAVLSVGVPDAECTAGSYRVAEDDAARLGREMRRLSIVSLAQLHTHPGCRTEHSLTDDLDAVSLRDGFLSIVLPYYGRRNGPLLGGATVHERWNGRWHVLAERAVPGRIRLVDDIVDQRCG